MHLEALHKLYFWGDQEYGILPESILTFNLLICAVGISPGSPDPYILYTENQKKNISSYATMMLPSGHN